MFTLHNINDAIQGTLLILIIGEIIEWYKLIKIRYQHHMAKK